MFAQGSHFQPRWTLSRALAALTTITLGAATHELEPAEINMLWFSPLMTQRLPEPPEFSAVLAKRASDVYSSFVSNVTSDARSEAAKALRLIVCDDGRCNDAPSKWRNFEEGHHMNDAFYQWQRTTNSAGLQSKEFDKLRQYVLQAVTKLRGATGAEAAVPPASTSQANPGGELFCWTSVHPSYSLHPAHTHATASFSAVFFAHAPPGSGALRLHDPRGPRPPFDLHFDVKASEGELAVFPSYLVHEVRPAAIQSPRAAPQVASMGVDGASELLKGGVAPRVSISCNVRGPWTEAADLSVSFET